MQKSLFDIKEIENKARMEIYKPKGRAVWTKPNSDAKIGLAMQKVDSAIGKIAMGKTIHFATMGEWSSHELLFHILDQTGPADVWISTWSVSEDAARLLIGKVETKAITRLNCLFDWRIKVRRPEVFQLVRYKIADIRLTTCHAKVTVVENDSWKVAVVGSANYTNNPRIEAGVIACDEKAADFHRKWIKDEIENSDPFDTKKRRANG